MDHPVDNIKQKPGHSLSGPSTVSKSSKTSKSIISFRKTTDLSDSDSDSDHEPVDNTSSVPKPTSNVVSKGSTLSSRQTFDDESDSDSESESETETKTVTSTLAKSTSLMKKDPTLTKSRKALKNQARLLERQKAEAKKKEPSSESEHIGFGKISLGNFDLGGIGALEAQRMITQEKIRILSKNRNGRKYITTIHNIPDEYFERPDFKDFLKTIKMKLTTHATIKYEGDEDSDSDKEKSSKSSPKRIVEFSGWNRPKVIEIICSYFECKEEDLNITAP